MEANRLRQAACRHVARAPQVNARNVARLFL
jgi:hypothetical protein